MKRDALNDELGNAAAHFFKSGNVLRSQVNDSLSDIKNILPTTHRGCRVEYDVWYDTGETSRVHGYVYTDMMTQLVYIKPASAKLCLEVTENASLHKITETGIMIHETLKASIGDKYKLRKHRNIEFPEFVIFLPGTNIFKDAVNRARLHNAISQGAKLKLHPLTARPLRTSIEMEYGEENIIDSKRNAYDLLRNASIVGCCDNSEMGLSALMLGKTVYRFTADADRMFTYSALYETIWKDGEPNLDYWLSILSSKNSGLIPVCADNHKEYIDGFFNTFKHREHIPPTD